MNGRIPQDKQVQLAGDEGWIEECPLYNADKHLVHSITKAMLRISCCEPLESETATHADIIINQALTTNG